MWEVCSLHISLAIWERNMLLKHFMAHSDFMTFGQTWNLIKKAFKILHNGMFFVLNPFVNELCLVISLGILCIFEFKVQ